MKKVFLLSLVLLLLTGNLFAQENTINSSQDSISNTQQLLYSSTGKNQKLKKISSSNTSSDKETGTLMGAVIGAGTGVVIAAVLGSISMEGGDRKASAGALILCGVFGAVIGAMVGGMASE